jgi:dTDP-4-amino-4,6-dideoxygalactose transaminase
VKEKGESLLYAGTVNKEACVSAELNHKIDALQAALLSVSLDHYRPAVAKRHGVALRYWHRIGRLVGFPTVPEIHDGRSFYVNMTVLCRRGVELLVVLLSKCIEALIKHPILMPDQPAHRDLPAPVIPTARALVKEIVTLPIHDKMTLDQVDFVCDCVEAHCREELRALA